MKKLYITFGGQGYDGTIERIVADGPKLGADQVLVYDDLWLHGSEFHRQNQWLWSFPEGQPHPSPRSHRGFGWFCWKPYILMHALDNFCEPGDIVMFTDADTYPIANFSVLYEECARIGGMMLFAAQGQNNRQWCKRDCFIVMGQDEPRYHDMQAGVARFMLFQRGPWRPRQFLTEWLTYCVHPLATSFEPSVLGSELEGFEQHRTEQAIMTLLAGKYGAKLYREACDFGGADDHDKDLYPTLFRQVGSCTTREIGGGSRFRNISSR